LLLLKLFDSVDNQVKQRSPAFVFSWCCCCSKSCLVRCACARQVPVPRAEPHSAASRQYVR
jgi:hypothetical protein